MSGDFIDENLPWPLWRPIAGTLAGMVAIMAWSLLSPIDTFLQSSMYGALTGRTALIFAVLYFPAYSRRGWPWRLSAFALILIVGAIANDAGRIPLASVVTTISR